MKHISVPDGTIILSQPDPEASWIMRFVSKQIQDVTGSPYVHAEMVLGRVGSDVQIFESTVWTHDIRIFSGIRYSIGRVVEPGCLLLIPRVPYPPEKVVLMGRFVEKYINRRVRYNFGKLLMLKLFYKKGNGTKWVPFSNNFFGLVCSVLMAEINLYAGYDVCLKSKEFCAPGDLRNLEFYRETAVLEETKLFPVY